MNIKFWFLQKNYPEKLVEKEISKVKFDFNLARDKVRNELVKVVPLVATYHPSFIRLSKIIKYKPYLLHKDKEVKKTFPIKPTASFKSPRKFSTYLMQTKMYSLERKVGSCRRNKKRCQI